MNNTLPEYFYGFPITPRRIPLVPVINPQQTTRNIYNANAFAPTGGAREWQRNELITHDKNIRFMARVQSMDDGLTEVYYQVPGQKL